MANLRKKNWAALKTANRSFVLSFREIELIGGIVVASTEPCFTAMAATKASSRNGS
ncbi:hypothetical protein P0R31_40400 [Bradyrhizobium yuanmingense]|uniref:hypothetical protein n=1 Tax=Bradyrhizobium yuanmingense TaxID=108015 RepID=UPI0023B9DB17|nr:hypothetical protein [Bradyrhizobium yuanmingense]MDF0523428.1 hypothetical protein [Bradyrhizobium yuanmingense]